MTIYIKQKIGVIGLGYVGQSMATLLSIWNDVTIYDINEGRYDLCREAQKTLKDKLTNTTINDLRQATDFKEVIGNTDIIVLALPTNYDVKNASFDTSALDSTIEKITKLSNDKIILIKSTVPIGYTENVREKYRSKKIIFSPEFLQEGSSNLENMNPDRIVVGDKTDVGKRIGSLLTSACASDTPPIVYCQPTEAEAIKLFANTFLAMRVAFFNELDSFCYHEKIDPEPVITAVSQDLRIGKGYNNPSFGYGGYCLPKDTKQLKKNFESIRSPLIDAIVESNDARKDFLGEQIINGHYSKVGIYHLRMKANSDNFRDAAIIDIIHYLKKRDVSVQIYEPLCDDMQIFGCEVIKSWIKFQETSDIIVANRKDTNLDNCKNIIFSRDLYGHN